MTACTNGRLLLIAHLPVITGTGEMAHTLMVVLARNRGDAA